MSTAVGFHDNAEILPPQNLHLSLVLKCFGVGRRGGWMGGGGGGRFAESINSPQGHPS